MPVQLQLSNPIPYSIYNARLLRWSRLRISQDCIFVPLLPRSLASHSEVTRSVSHCARPTRAFLGRALREHTRPAGHLPASFPSLTRKRSGDYS